MIGEVTGGSIVLGVSFAVYSLAIVAVGLYSARYAKRSDEDYFLAGRSLRSWVAALSASASSESGWVTLGLVGWAFAEGFKAYWIIPGCLCGFVFNWFVLAGRLSDESRRLGALTIPDYFALRFNERLPIVRVLSVIVILVAMMLYVAAQFAAAGKSFAAVFDGVEYWHGVLIGAAIVLVYTVTGGFRAVCWTDFMQALLMVGTLVMFPIYLLWRDGGFGPTLDQLRSADPTLLEFTPQGAPIVFLGFLLGAGALGINFGYPGQPHVLVRFMSLRDRNQARWGGVIAVVWGLFVYWGAVTVGLFARAAAERGTEWAQALFKSEELGLVLSAMHMLPGLLSGLVLAAVLAAICSTADSQLVVAGSAVSSDLYARILGGGKRTSHLLLNRVTIFVLGVIAVLLVIRQEVKVYTYVLTYGWAILGASFGPQMILALFWRRASYAGCIAGMLTGFAVAIAWKALCDNKLGGVEVYNLPLAFVAALIVNVIVSRLAPSPTPGD
ncbi:MAG: sodium/proline symporter [Planctomycetes bacterium]|nr:sodium/proline symporter [Planctomycetota bacterium]